MGATEENSPGVLKVLIVEDHVDSARAMSRLLRTLGYHVDMAHTAEDGKRIAETMNADLLISDLLLPDGNGLDLMRHLRGTLPGIKGIAISGMGSDGDVRDCHDAGFIAHIAKPVDFGKLREVIGQVIKA